MSADLTALASAIIAGQGLLLIGVVLAAGRDRPLANALLAALIAVITLRIAVFHLLAQGLSYPALLGPLSQVFLLGGPVLYLYAQVLARPVFRWRRRHLLHLLLPLASAAATPWLYSPHSFIGGFPPDAATAQLHSLHKLVAAAAFILYVASAMREARRDNAAIEPAATIWLRELLLLSLLGALAVAAWCLRLLFGPDTSRSLTEAIEFGGYALLFYLIATAGVRRHLRPGAKPLPAVENATPAEPVAAPLAQPETAAANQAAEAAPPIAELTHPPPAEPAETRGKYERTSLTETRARRLWERVTAHMERDEPYLDCDLSLAELAAAVDSYPRELSQVLNTVGGQTFYDFVNGYRAAKARELIRNGDHGAMVDIALAAGFNGRSTLYKHFVKCFAVTPSQFRKTCSAA